MHATGKLVLVIALSSCATGRAGFTAETSSSAPDRSDVCSQDLACSPTGTGSQEYLAWIGLASMVGVATVTKLLR
jgi:hypothetical protein